VLGIDAGLDALGEIDLLGGVEQRNPADLVQVVADWVGRDTRLVGIKIGLVFDKIGDRSWLGVGAGGRDRDYRGVGNRLELVRDEFDDADDRFGGQNLVGWLRRRVVAITRGNGGLLRGTSSYLCNA
jgi:hypothetical protein